MTRKERRRVYEAAAIAGSGLTGIFVVPTLINAHESLALLAGLILAVGWFGWLAYFFYRMED